METGRTGSEPHSLDVVCRTIVFYPRPVGVVGGGAHRVRVRRKHLRDGAVAQQAGGEGHLQREPVL